MPDRVLRAIDAPVIDHRGPAFAALGAVCAVHNETSTGVTSRISETRRAVRAWGLTLNCADEREYSNALTAVLLPEGHDEAKLRAKILERFDLSLGQGLGKVRGKLFRIGHLGDFNDLTLCGTLCGVEMGLGLAGVPSHPGGVAAAMEFLAANPG